jgi:hypothetical protein
MLCKNDDHSRIPTVVMAIDHRIAMEINLQPIPTQTVTIVIDHPIATKIVTPTVIVPGDTARVHAQTIRRTTVVHPLLRRHVGASWHQRIREHLFNQRKQIKARARTDSMDKDHMSHTDRMMGF